MEKFRVRIIRSEEVLLDKSFNLASLAFNEAEAYLGIDILDSYTCKKEAYGNYRRLVFSSVSYHILVIISYLQDKEAGKKLTLQEALKEVEGKVLQAKEEGTLRLKIGTNNAKLKALGKYLGIKAGTLDLPSGITCKAAYLCKASIDTSTGKIVKGKEAVFLCYASKLEAIYRNYLLSNYHNYYALQACNYTEKVELLTASIREAGIQVLRFHASGDLFSLEYFKALVEASTGLPSVTFFGYTKILPFIRLLQEKKVEAGSNFKLQYSIGSIYDSKYTVEVPACYVLPKEAEVYSYDSLSFTRITVEGKEVILPVQVEKHDDYKFIVEGRSFGIKVH